MRPAVCTAKVQSHGSATSPEHCGWMITGELDEADRDSLTALVLPALEAPAPLPDLEGAGGGQGEGGVLSRRPVDPWLFLLAGLFLLAEGVLRTRKPKTA